MYAIAAILGCYSDSFIGDTLPLRAHFIEQVASRPAHAAGLKVGPATAVPSACSSPTL